ncbi:GNAT family N-acetyltransferase [Rhizobium sp. FY34]|uniref:GNAT family N-acetyltransferase n=1 Tax=Rhizobium sp. FY34 TaxID=2562309 RepID=UPI0010C01A05|nr:GNAT family N-acetyltransferase [Rhizobium sp. FY34]
MQIILEDTQSGGRYHAELAGHSAEMTFSRADPHLIVIDHTQVDDALRGKGVGQALAEHAVDEARKGGWKIIPLCPFFQAQVSRHPDWRNVIQG